MMEKEARPLPRQRKRGPCPAVLRGRKLEREHMKTRIFTWPTY